jgi:hypothetical protein
MHAYTCEYACTYHYKVLACLTHSLTQNLFMKTIPASRIKTCIKRWTQFWCDIDMTFDVKNYTQSMPSWHEFDTSNFIIFTAFLTSAWRNVDTIFYTNSTHFLTQIWCMFWREFDVVFENRICPNLNYLRLFYLIYIF